MPRVVPSQVVNFVNALWPTAEQQRSLNRAQQGQLSGLVSLIDQIPSELLVMDAATYALFVCGRAHIFQKLVYWASSDPNRGHDLGTMPGQPEQIPVTVIRDALATCPDESPAPGTSELGFISAPDLRTNLRNDIGAVHRALTNGEWKAATVLAGSAAEALLLWALGRRTRAEIATAITELRAKRELSTDPDPDKLEWWNLYEFIKVTEKLGVIKPNTATQAMLAKDFRNFIHPGVAKRFGEKCNRPTALSAVAGMEHVVNDLTP
jgi:hypothetical protein